MADFDSGIDDYGTIDGTVEDISGDAFLTLDVSNMTVQDIKNYIDLLSQQAGYLTSDEIEEKIQIIAAAAGMLSQAEIENLVVSTITSAGALTASDADDRIETKVAEAILDLNDNKDYVDDIRTSLKRDIDRLRTEIRLIQQDGNETHEDIQNLTGEYNYQIERIQQSLNLFESIISSIVENKEVYNLLDVERVTRAQEILNVNTTMSINKSSVDTEMAIVKAQAVGTTERVNTLTTDTNASITTLENNVRSRMDLIEAELRDSSATLSSLLLSGDALVEKLQALNTIDLGENGNIVVNLQTEFDDLEAEVASLKTQTENYSNTLTLKIQEMDELSTSLTDDMLNNTALITTGLDNLGGSLSIETAERKLSYDLILKEWGDFTTDVVAKFTSTQAQVNKFITDISDIPNTINNLISVEQQSRMQNDTALDIRITDEVQKLIESIQDTNQDAEIETLRQTLSDQAQKLSDFITETRTGLFASLTTDVATLDAKVDVNQSISDGKISVEIVAREQGDLGSASSLENEASIRETRVQELKDQILSINSLVDGIIAAMATEDTTPLQVAIDDLNDRYNSLFVQADNTDDSLTTSVVQLTDRIQAAEATIAAVQTAGINDVQSEASARVLGDSNLQTSIDTILVDVNDISNAVLAEDNNFANVYTAINSVAVELAAFKVDFDDDLEISIANLSDELILLDSTTQNITSALAAEALTREAGILAVDGRVNEVDAKLAPIENQLRSEILQVRTDNSADTAVVVSDLAIEVQARIDGDLLRNTEIDTLDTRLTDGLVDINTSFTTLSSATDSSIGTINDNLAQEIADRVQGDNDLQVAVAAEAVNRTTADNTLDAKIEAQSVVIQSIVSNDDINMENLRAVLEIIQNINDDPDANVTAELLSGLNDIEANLTALVQAEEDARVQALIDLNNSLTALIDSGAVNLGTEATSRIDADNALTASISAKATEAVDGDIALGLRIDQEIIDRTTADNNVSVLVSTETARAEAEELVIVGLVEDEEAARTIAIDTLTNDLQSANNTLVDSTSRVTVLETKEAALMLGLPVEVQTLKELLDVVTGNYTLDNTRITDEVAALDAKITTNLDNLSIETTARLLQDGILAGDILNNRTDFEADDVIIRNSITSEESARIQSDNDILLQISGVIDINDTQQDEIDALDVDLVAEIANRIQGDLDIQFDGLTKDQAAFDAATFKNVLALSDAVDAVDLRVDTTNGGLAQEIIDRVTEDGILANGISDEILDRTTADGTLQTNLNTVEGNLVSSINGVDTRLGTAETTIASIMLDSDSAADSFKELKTIIDTNNTTVTSAINTLDTDLSLDISNNTGLIDNEALTRSNADGTLNTKIDTEIGNRISADGTLQDNIDDEASARSTADTTLQGNINNEGTARSLADGTLQDNIDAKPDTFDELDDTNATKTGSELYLLRVNAAGTAIEYIDQTVVQYQPRLDTVLESTDITSTIYVQDGGETDRIDVITYSNGYTATYVYNVGDLLTSIEYDNDGATLLATKAFTYNGNDRLDTITWTDA